jgi:hypothetical protein
MARRTRRAGGRGPAPLADAEIPLVERLGLRVGERVRFRRRSTGRWRDGVVTGLERDGSVGVRDGDGRARALLPEAVEVSRPGRRGGAGWEPLVERARRSLQLKLWE